MVVGGDVDLTGDLDPRHVLSPCVDHAVVAGQGGLPVLVVAGTAGVTETVADGPVDAHEDRVVAVVGVVEPVLGGATVQRRGRDRVGVAGLGHGPTGRARGREGDVGVDEPLHARLVDECLRPGGAFDGAVAGALATP